MARLKIVSLSAESHRKMTNDNLTDPYDNRTPDNQDHAQATSGSSPLDLFKPAPDYRVTPILLWINIGLFALMALTGVDVMQPSSEGLIRWGANFTPLTLDGQPWRLLTCCFIHIGILHLVFNMYALMQIGPILEPLLGSVQFGVTYVVTGLMGSVASLWWHDIIVSAGASGAIFGLYGVFLALLTTNWLPAEVRNGMLKSIALFVGFNLMLGMSAGIDNAAHIGGLLSGLLTGYTYYLFMLRAGRSANQPLVPLLFPAALVLAMAVLVYAYTDNPMAKYEKIMERFGELERQAMDSFKLPPNTPAKGVADALSERGIPAWQEAIRTLQQADSLELSESLDRRTALLKRYSQLRLNNFQLLQKSLRDTTHAYDTQIEATERQINEVMKQLKASR